MWLQNNYVRFSITCLLTLQYSLLRTTELSTFVKPLPILFWLCVVLFSVKRSGGVWVVCSLFCAALGDVLLDLGSEWLIAATIPFLASTLLLTVAFHVRGDRTRFKSNWHLETLILLPIAALAIGFHQFMAPLMGEAAKIGAVLMLLSTGLIWRALSSLVLQNDASDTRFYKMIGFIGACGIVSNYVLYSINIGLREVPRDLVIQLYYWGQAFVAWSFLKPQKTED